jgi:hypothetical protein
LAAAKSTLIKTPPQTPKHPNLLLNHV